MELSGKIKITIEVDDEDNNYCCKECLYFMPSICNLPLITGGSDYCHKYDEIKNKHLRTDTCKELTNGELEEI
ncbi:hypothetical protein Q5M87_04795 [Brachyspira innocens]|uniref:hypothetical protein n=1 Tax=Brachyspira innocens TaxID=13264 RepID=UPI0026EEC91A|nr:hypothetical protein [Brachyspira innocens]MDO6993322.1 hypothetical protein [Brachyspira innocens]